MNDILVEEEKPKFIKTSRLRSRDKSFDSIGNSSDMNVPDDLSQKTVRRAGVSEDTGAFASTGRIRIHSKDIGSPYGGIDFSGSMLKYVSLLSLIVLVSVASIFYNGVFAPLAVIVVIIMSIMGGVMHNIPQIVVIAIGFLVVLAGMFTHNLGIVFPSLVVYLSSYIVFRNV